MNTQSSRAGFSLVELIAAVLVIGILVGVAAPKMCNQLNESEIEATIQGLKTMALAAEMHHNDLGAWPPDAVRGAMPVGMEAYLRPNLFATTPPVGGQYDWDNGTAVAVAAIKVSSDSPNFTVWNEIDARMDDGVPGSGDLQVVESGPYWHLVWILEH